jgi:lipopolysaccharide transport protein LptA
MNRYLNWIVAATLLATTPTLAQEAPPAESEGLMSLDFSAETTVIEADALTLQAKKRAFTYNGNVKVDHGDLKLTCKKLDGTYTEANEIDTLIATQDVYIEKGPTIKATGQRAVFNSIKQTLVLSENPELIQQGSILSADEVVIYLQEDRSEAIGNVRVTILDNQGDASGALQSSKDKKSDGKAKGKKKGGKKSA